MITRKETNPYGHISIFKINTSPDFFELKDFNALDLCSSNSNFLLDEDEAGGREEDMSYGCNEGV